MIINFSNLLNAVPLFGMGVTLFDNAWKISPHKNYPLKYGNELPDGTIEEYIPTPDQIKKDGYGPSWRLIGNPHNAKLYLTPLSKIVYLAAKTFITGMCFVIIEKYLEKHFVTPLLSIGHGPDLDLPRLLKTTSQVIGLVSGWIFSYVVTSVMTDRIVASFAYNTLNRIDPFGPSTEKK